MTLVSIKIVDFRKVTKQMDRLDYTDIAFIFCEPNWATDRYCGFFKLTRFRWYFQALLTELDEIMQTFDQYLLSEVIRLNAKEKSEKLEEVISLQVN